ncbi:hypothetical protein QFC19_001597 [Naganishia cerealis]|uniref:Uncharacterized protein n=1 Tax=Naganishia cerealis TaxID=610337 RepID=A0ACC2WI42_9TREE|nr:hypothetical protein QFC19_001597 [Naganishia cerealis]
MSDVSFEFEKYMIIELQVTIVPKTSETLYNSQKDIDHGNPQDERPSNPEIVQIPKDREYSGKIVVSVSEVEDGWLLLDYGDEPMKELKNTSSMRTPVP